MRKYAVAYIFFFDNILKLKVIEAKDWKDALIKAFNMGYWVGFPDDMEEAQEEAFKGDWMFNVIEVA
jgi:hypothetical protein